MLSESFFSLWLGEFLTSWNSVKIFVEYLTNVSHDLLHVVVGFGAWLLIAAATRRPISSALPLALTFVLAMINEAADLWVEIWPAPPRQFGEFTKDLLVTMFVPLVLFLLARFHPRLFEPRSLKSD